MARNGKGTLVFDFDKGNEIVATENLFPLRYMFNSLQTSRMPESGPWRLSSRLSLIVNVVGILLLVTAPFWLFELFVIYDEEMSISLFAAAFTVALIMSFNYFLILHCTRRHPSLRRLMAVGMLAKLAAAGLYVTMVVRVYDYGADMPHYFYAAQGLATNYVQTGVLTVPDPLWGTNFPSFLAQCIFVVTGISLPVAMVIFASMSFWGAYLIYRAFCIGFPNATRFDMIATLAFLLPSCVFWTASLSKDAVVMLGAGIATYGFARVHHRAGLQGYVLLVTGLAVIMTVRPHMAGIMALAFIFPYLFGANRTGMSGLALKVIGIPALVGLTWVFVSQAETYVEMSDFSQGRVGRDASCEKQLGLWRVNLWRVARFADGAGAVSAHPAIPFRSPQFSGRVCFARGTGAASHIRAAEKSALSYAGADQVKPVCHVLGAVHDRVHDHLRSSHDQFWPVEPAAGDVGAVYVNALSR